MGNSGWHCKYRCDNRTHTCFVPLDMGCHSPDFHICIQVYAPYKSIRDEIKEIERQFADALFVLGRRISEGRSPEWAFMQTAQTMKGTGIGKAFQNVAQNISFLRTTLAGAIFDQKYGAFKNIYSERVHTTMRLFTESVYKSHEAAGVAIVKLADHLKDLQEVEDNIKSSLYDVTSTMKTTV